MKYLFTLVFTVFIFFNAKAQFDYWSQDSLLSEPFNHIQFLLMKKNEVILIVIKKVNTDEGFPLPDVRWYKGKWKIINKQIHCKIEETNEFLKNAFFDYPNKNEKIIQNGNELIFPKGLNPIYLYGEPLYLKKNTNR